MSALCTSMPYASPSASISPFTAGLSSTFCTAISDALCSASSNSAAYSPCISCPKALRFSAGSVGFGSCSGCPCCVSGFSSPGASSLLGSSFVGVPASAPPSADGAGAAFTALPGRLRFASRSCAGRSSGACTAGAASAPSPAAPPSPPPSANSCRSIPPNGLWLPASTSCLGRHSCPAGHGPNLGSLFLPLAVVASVAANSCRFIFPSTMSGNCAGSGALPSANTMFTTSSTFSG